MAERKKRGLGRGLGALIPDANSTDRPVDVFFSGSNAEEGTGEAEKEKTSRAARNDPAASMQSSRRRKTKAASSHKSTDASEDKTATSRTSGSASTTKKSTTRSTTAGTKAAGTKTAGTKAGGSGATAAKSGTRKTSAATASTTKKSSTAKPSASRKTADAKSTDTKTAGSRKTTTETTPTVSQSSATKTVKNSSSATTAAESSAAAKSTPARKTPSSAATTDSSTASAAAAESPTSSVKSSAPAEEATPSATKASESTPESTPAAADTAETAPEPASADVDAGRGIAEVQPSVSSEASAVTDEGKPTEKTDSSPSDARDQSEDVREKHPGVYTSSGYGNQGESGAAVKPSEPEDTTDVVASVPDATRYGGHDYETSGQSVKASVTDEETGREASTTSSEDTVDEDGYTSTAENESDDGSFDEVESIPDTEFGEIPVDLIDANPRQPRTVFDEDLLAELVHSIREIGVLQPVVVRQKPSDRSRFELIMGERRLRATKDAGLSTIPAIIRYVDNTDLLRDALLENLHRAELNPLEEAAAYGQLLEDFGCTQEELSERIGRSRPQISNTLRLLRLPPLVQRRVAAGVISAGHARAILGLRDPEQMEVLAQRIVAEGLSVRASEEAVVLLNRGDSVNVSRATTKVSPEFLAVAERLGDHLDTKVNISVGKRKGKLSVEFANQEDLDRILGLLGIEDQDGI